MNWNIIREAHELDQLVSESQQSLVLIFKHSNRCSISAAALDRLERRWEESEMINTKPYFLDIFQYRSLSNKIADDFNLIHQSPQIIALRGGKVVYDASHFSIDYDELLELNAQGV